MRSRLVTAVVSVGSVVAALVATGTPGAVAGAVSAGGGAQLRLSAAQARVLSTDVTQRVIVELKDPVPAAGAATRAQAVDAAQRSVVAELAETGARDVHRYQLIDALSATVSPGEEARLEADPAVSEVIPDEEITMPTAATAAVDAAATVGTPVIPPDDACLPNGQVQLDPQADSDIDAISQTPGAKTAASLGYTGAGVKVGFIADGLDTDDPDFIRPNGQHVFVDYQDFSGSGTGSPTGGEEAFLDAGSIAAQGAVVYNVADYSALPDAEPCNIKIEGVAPGASLVGLDVFGDESFVYTSVILEAIDYAVTTAHVNVLNESLGGNPFPDVATLDAFKQADNAAVAAGVTVTVSSGDAGVTNTIGSPAGDPQLISVGASTTYRIDAQDGYGGARLPGVTGWLDDNISSLSSGGVAEDGSTVSVVAPGELNWLPCSADVAMYADCVDLAGNPTAFQQSGGTSESAPVTAGVAALVIQAYREAHGGRSPAPAVVKEIITSTARPIDAPGDQQGAGLVDAYQAVLAAKSYHAAPAGDTVLTSPSQLDFSGQPGTAETAAVTVTNNGSSTQTVAAATHRLGTYTSIARARVVLSDTASAHALDWQGIEDNVEKVTFVVPAGQDRLNAAIAFQNASLTNLAARVRLTLVDSEGRLAAYSVPQGDGNYGDVQVSAPAAGRWTAYIYSRNSGAGGTTGPVVFGASVAHWVPLGHVRPARLTLAPGRSGTFTVTASTTATPGDEAGSLLLSATAAGVSTGQTSVPIVLRAEIPTGPATFTGTLTGGNGRASGTGQTAYYALVLPAGVPELNASITVANVNDQFSAELVDPEGAAVSVASNETESTSTSGLVPVLHLGAQLHALAPAAGLWHLLIDFAPTVSGTVVSSKFTVAVNEAPVGPTASGVPDSASTTLTAGAAAHATITVTNRGTAPEEYFLDARLDTKATVNLANQSGSADTVTPGSPGVAYIVPTDTTSIGWSATASIPIFDEVTYFNGDPDLVGPERGTAVSDHFAADPVTPGPWLNIPEFVGPDATTGEPTVAAATHMAATIAAFDPAVSSPTGDLWKTALSPDATFNFVVVGPGQSATIPLTIVPKGAAGKVVTGRIYVDDASVDAFGLTLVPFGSQVAAVPYEYKIRG